MPNFVIVVSYQSEADCDTLLGQIETVCNTFLESGKTSALPTTVAGPDGIFRNIVPVTSLAAGNELLNQLYFAAKQQNITVTCSIVDVDNPDPVARAYKL